MMGPSRTLSRAGVVRAAGEGCVTIEVGVPCGGCRQAACVSRRPAARLTLPGTDLDPGDRVEIALGAERLTRLSMALFGPPLIWLLITGWLVSDPAAVGQVSSMVVLCMSIAGMAIAVMLGVWLGRRQTGQLAVNVIPLRALPTEAAEV